MTVRYQRGTGGKLQPVYVCARQKSDYGCGQCQQLAGSCVDSYVTGLLLDALAPAALEVSLAAAEQAGAQRAEAGRIWRQRLERADFTAGRARRQYQLASPKTGWWPGNWKPAGRPHWPSVSAWATSMTASPPPVPGR
jgi:hypothetical protein